MDEENITKSVDCRGYMDDPYCPDCNAAIPESETDCPVCPFCGCHLDWKIYHILNDQEVKNDESLFVWF